MKEHLDLTEYFEYALDKIGQFYDHYEENLRNNPEQYPSHLTLEEWEDQFNAFMVQNKQVFTSE